MTTDISGVGQDELPEVDRPFDHPERLKYAADFDLIRERNTGNWTRLKACENKLQARNLAAAIRSGKVTVPKGKWDIASDSVNVWVRYLEPADEIVIVPTKRGRRKLVWD